MEKSNRIRLSKYQFAQLFEEVNCLCPLCSEELLIQKGDKQTALAEAAHVYPHSPSDAELEDLKDVPKLSENVESIENLIMLCPTCHTKFDKPRTRDDYIQIYRIKKLFTTRRRAREHYSKHDLESELIEALKAIAELNPINNLQVLSYDAIVVEKKMNRGASKGLINAVTRDVRDFYLAIKNVLLQLERDKPGISDMIAKEVGLFYSRLLLLKYSQDDIYYAIIDWIDTKTLHQFTFASPFITAFYIQNCEVFSL